MKFSIIWLCALGILLSSNALDAQSKASDQNLSIWVNGVCGMCKDRIQKAAFRTTGVRTASWDVNSKILAVTFDKGKFSEDQLHRTIAGVGHDTEKRKAPDEVYAKLHQCCLYDRSLAPPANKTETPSGKTLQEKALEQNMSIWVNGLCGMCEDRIQKTALRTPGVRTAVWDIDTKMLAVAYDPGKFDEDKLHANIANVGHDTEKRKAPDEVYEKLHECCHYDRSETPPAKKADSPGGGAMQEKAPERIKGRVLEELKKGESTPLIGASVHWAGTTQGVTTDADGQFELDPNPNTNLLVVSYIGYSPDTLEVRDGFEIDIVLSNTHTLKEVEVSYRRKATEVSFFAPVQVQLITERELLKAACCNLSESFETTPSVDVSFTDAVTGTRQIQLLGLAGPNIQITRESMPDVRGLSALYGMSYTAGPWIEGIQLSMGAGSVANGFEAIAGQINVELRKPEDSDPMYLNLYAADMGRYEGNLNLSSKLNSKWSAGLLLHAKSQQRELDHNHDGFLDNPLSDALVAINRWKFQSDNGWEAQFGVKGALLSEKSGVGGFHDDPETHFNHWWGAEVATKRAEAWAKIGRVFPNKPYASIGLQLSGIRHEQRAYFGIRELDGDQKSAYANLIYQSIIGNTNHKYRTGASFQWDNFTENADNRLFQRDERIPGVFFEYTYQSTERFTAVAGIRADHHNNYGLFFTPRLHLSWTPKDLTVVRLSAARGQRTASIWAENIGIWASSRNIVLHGESNGKPYGLDPEAAWNFGLNFTQGFSLMARPATFTAGLYHTDFVNQIVVDFDQNPRDVHIYNLQGRSWSNSFMAQADVELIPDFDVRIAYRFNDVRITFADGLLEKPLLSRHRAFLNLAYATKSDWHFDFTLNWQGAKRIPSTAANPPQYQALQRSPDFFLANAQISKRWGQKFDLYIGAENLFGFTQRNPIIGADDPFGPYFDSSLVWGPIFGRNVYVGGRWRIQRQKA